MEFVCLDLEGVLVPEVWIGVAEATGVEALAATTRDIPDYDELMQQRIRLLAENDLGIDTIEEVIGGMRPMPGAVAFLDWLRERFQVVILSDTFYQFGMPLMRHLGYPALLCHRLDVDAGGRITGYQLRQADPKRKAVAALRQLNFRTLAAGDSYNDISMLDEADAGIFFRPPATVIERYPQYPVARDYQQLRDQLLIASLEY